MIRLKLVLDASVLVKWFAEEIGHDHALLLRDQFLRQEVSIAIPDLALYEVANALRYKPKVTTEIVEQATTALFRFQLDIYAANTELLREAIYFSFKEKLTVYDALYLALAKHLGATLVTADTALAKAAVRHVPVKPLLSIA